MKILFSSNQFSNININSLDDNAFVYCDPPYLITNANYSDGTRRFGDWTNKHEDEFLYFLDKLNERNIKFVLSNVIKHNGYVNEKLINWSKKYKVIKILSDYSNSNYQSKTKKHETKEVLVINY